METKKNIINKTEVAKSKEKPEMPFWRPIPTALLTALIFLGSQVLAGLIIYGLPALMGWSNDRTEDWIDTALAQFILIALVEGFVMVMLLGVLRLKRAKFADIGLKWPKLGDLGYALAGFGIYFLLFMGLSIIVQMVAPEVNLNQQQELGYSTAETGGTLLLIFISLVILPPIVEEVLARGFLYTGLRTKLPIWSAALITSLIFAAAHLQAGSGNSLLWVAAIDTFTLSLVLVYLREKTGGLGAPILLHMLKNGLAFTLLFVIKVI